jgi:hypothetical protein
VAFQNNGHCLEVHTAQHSTLHAILTILTSNFTADNVVKSSIQQICHTCRSMAVNPLLSLTLQSAQDLNVPCQPKCSKALLLSYTFKCLLKKTQSFCPCSRVLNRSGKGLIKREIKESLSIAWKHITVGEQMYSYTISQPQHYMEVSGQLLTPGTHWVGGWVCPRASLDID